MVTSKTSPGQYQKKYKNQPKHWATCGGTNCFERSRYFPGQLLTNEDLEADQRYFIEKNKLHNRYLVGSGVVCGLAVRCHPTCEGVVVIEPGYAIDCGGNDIVLCDSTEFDIVAYLDACRREEEINCYSRISSSSRCEDISKDYCLLLSFQEEPAKPVTALVQGNGNGNRRCEPSRIKETFRLDLVPKDEFDDRVNPPDFWSKLQTCINTFLPKMQGFIEALEQARREFDASGNENLSQYHTTVFKIFCQMKAWALDLYKTHPKVRCTLREELQELEASFPQQPQSVTETTLNNYLQQVSNTVSRISFLIFQLLKDCFCDALLVPCTECTDEGVLLACLSLSGKQVDQICNTVRQPVLSGPSLNYCLQPLYTALDSVLEEFCCEEPEDAPKVVIAPVDTPPDSVEIPGEAPTEISSTMQQFEFQPLMAPFTRSNALAALGREHALSGAILNLGDFITSQLTNSNPLTAADLYNRPRAEVEVILQDHDITWEVHSTTSVAEAYSLANLSQITWGNIPANSEVELVVSPEGLVTSIRIVPEEE